MDEITAVVCTSPIKSHPDTSILETTIKSIRHHLPKSEIIITFDGVREENKDWTDRYNEFKNKMLWKCLHEYTNVLPIIFQEHQHQSGMMNSVISEIKTPLLLYVEGDAPLVTDERIDFKKCVEFIMGGEANTIRFHHEGVIPVEHHHLMLKTKDKFLQTIQWSQRPMLSSVAYYRDVVLPNVPDKSFIEDTFHSVVQQDYYNDGMIGWYRHRLWIYIPNEKNIKRSYHLDGRNGGKKFTSDDEAWGL